MLTDAIKNHFSAADWALIAPEQLALAESQALEVYAQTSPNILQSTLPFFGQTITLPQAFIDGFSVVLGVEYPVDVVPELVPNPAEGEDGVTAQFNFAEWTLSGGRYFIDITHGTETLTPITKIIQNGTTVEVEQIEALTTNVLRLWIPFFDDTETRFSGIIMIERA